jgi:hypothetical protein
MSSYLVYICQAVKNRAGLERYWQLAPAAYPKNIDVLAAYGPCEVLDADQPGGPATSEEGCEVPGSPDRRWSAARRATDAAHSSCCLSSAPPGVNDIDSSV